MWARIIKRHTKLIFRFRLSVCNYTNESATKQRKYVFRDVRNNSIIRDFTYGLINPKLLKMPESQQSDTLVNSLITQLNHLPKEMPVRSFLDQMKKLGLFGAMIPSKYGGLGLSMTHYAYLIEHERLIDWVLTLTAHQNLCAQTILQYGSEEQKERYLPRLCSGELIGAFCLTENSSGSDMASMDTIGLLNALEDHYVVHGTKNWVVNGAVADVMIVFAVTEDSRYEGGRKHLTALIVDRVMQGITVTKQYRIDCLPNSNLADISFESVFVPVTNVLFEDHGGYKIANYIQNMARAMVGPCLTGALRVLIEDLADRDRVGAFNDDSHLRDLVNESVSYLYAIESGLFFTTRFADRYEVPEIELESAALKVFTIDGAKTIANNYLRILAITDCTVSPEMARLCDRVTYLQSFMGSNYFVKLYIGGTMIQLSEYTFREIQERVKSPIENFTFLAGMYKNVKKQIQWTSEVTDAKYSNIVERSLFLTELGHIYRKLQRTRMALHRAIRRYNEATIDHQHIVEAMAHIGTLVYIVSCCVARANTNYGDFEIACTKMILERVKYIIDNNVASLAYVAKQGHLSLFYPLSEDIKEANGYASANILDIVKLCDSVSSDDTDDQRRRGRVTN